MRQLVIVLALALASGTASLAAASPATRPALRLVDAGPVVFRGSGFKAHERVRVVVYAQTRAAKRTTASLTGAFTVRFAGLDPSACAGLSATAVGDGGSRASFKRPPGQCPAP
jgi:hypothetical protein